MMETLRLSATQEKIVQYGDGALLVVAGPGSGKTRVLTERIRWLLSDEKSHFRILALTFTNKAANEMQERLNEFPDIKQKSFLGTLHSFCLEVLSTRGAAVGVEAPLHIFESFQDRKQVLLQAVNSDPALQRTLTGAGNSKEQDKMLVRWLEMISDTKSKLRFPDSLEDETESLVCCSYDQALRASRAYDFDDLLLLVYRLFIERPKIADFFRRQYRYIFIDEAQDINEAQYRVIQALCGETYRNVMMVGDPKQAIFVWNGASPKYLDLFRKDFAAHKIELKENFRSSKAIVDAASKLIGAYVVEGQLAINGELVVIEADNETSEAESIIERIVQLQRDGHPDVEGAISLDRIAVIARSRYAFIQLEKELASLSIPFYKKVSTQHESESDLVKGFELCLRVLSNPNDRLHLGMLSKLWCIPLEDVPWGDSDAILTKLCCVAQEANHATILAAIKKLRSNVTNPPMLEALNILEDFSKSKDEEEERVCVSQDATVWRNHWDVFLRNRSSGAPLISTFLSHVALGSTQQPRQDGVALLTVHSAKGLEFDVVFVIGMTEGAFPDYRAKDAQALEEERRNAFVAVTRSKRLLFLSYPKEKQVPWGTQTPKRSRFVDLICQ